MPRGGRAWRKLRHHILTTRPAVCGECGEPIDLGLSGYHQYGPTVDHIVPVTHGGTDHPTNLQPAHRACNLRKGANTNTNRTSRDW